MKKSLISIAVALLTTVTISANAAVNLANYQVSGTYALDIFNGTSGGISGLEGSAITYAQDRNSLFFVGDEGTGVIEMSLTGQTLGYMNFDWSGTGSTKHDTEGLAYVGGGQLVVGEERLQDAYKFTYANNGTATLANNFVSISNTTVGNSGMEGISYDPRNSSFVTVKQENPEDILSGTLTFGAGTGGTSTMSNLFNPNTLGLSSFSDVQTLGILGSDDLLVLSLVSRMLVETDRLGNIKSSFDLSNVLPHNGIEGVTIDQFGTIYLIAEQIQDGTEGLNPQSQLIVLSALAPIPEPETYALFLAGLGLLGFVTRHRKSKLNHTI